MKYLGSVQGQRGHAVAWWGSRSGRVTAPRRHHGRLGLKPELRLLEDRRLLAIFTVTSSADNGSSNTLRWAVAQANAATTASSIEIELGTSAATIALTNGQLELSNTKAAISIYDVPGQGPVTISGGGVSRVFQIDSQATGTFTGLTIASGSAQGNGGGVYNAGGATLNLLDCTIQSSAATGMGGGLDSDGTATLTDCTISGNTSKGYGGGIENSSYSKTTATMMLINCTISGNSSTSGSGGVNNNGTAELTDCTLSGNTCQRDGAAFSTNNGWAELTGCTMSNNSATDSGGGFASFGGTAPSELTDCTLSGNTTQGPGGALDDMAETVDLTNCTLSNNTSQRQGGGVSIEGGATVDLTACTISRNTTPGPGGGLYNQGTATLTDTIVAANSSTNGDDIDGSSTVTGSHNLVGTSSAGLVNGQNGNIVGATVPVLSALGSYGGQTQTMAILPGSPAIGAGAVVSGITSDQRGAPLDSPSPDIGAFQSHGFTMALVAGSTPQSTIDETAFPNPLALTVMANNSEDPVAGGVVTFVVPSSGASAQLASNDVTIGSNGVASVNATANATAGSYAVTASTIGIAGSLQFNLTNNLIPLNFSDLTAPEITYGTPSVTIAGTLAYDSFVPVGETVAITLNGVAQSATINTDGSFSTTFNTSTLPVSGSPYSVSCAYITDGNFASASATASVAITQAMPAITWYNPASIIYGTALGATQLDATASVPGNFTYTPSAGTILTVGSGQTLSVSFTPTDNINYTTAVATATINVTKATPSITWTNPVAISFGTALSSVQLDATTSVPGTFTYTPAAGTVLNVGNGQTLSVSFAPTDTTDYNTAAAKATINVDKAPPTITWANPADITYGTPLGALQFDATANVAGTFTQTPVLGKVLHAGNDQTLSVTFTPANTADYTTVTATARINVDKATPSIMWANPSDIIYGTALSSSQLDATASWIVNGSSQNVGGTFTYNPDAGDVLGAGNNQTLSVSFTPNDTLDYNTTSATATINVDEAMPAVTWADPADITYGTTLSSDQLDATASVPGTFMYTPALGTMLDAGNDQTLLVTFTPTDATDYTAVTATAMINVDKAAPAITWANPADIAYGTTLSSAQLDATAPVPGSFSYTPSAGILLNAGAGQMLSASFTPTDTMDYATATATVLINVDKAAPVITWANPADIIYGAALSSTQLDAAASVPGSFSYAPAAGTVLPAGNGQTLAAFFTPTDTTDYATASSTSTIDVAKAAPTLSVSAPGGNYNGTPFPASVRIEGIANSSATALEGVTPLVAYYEGPSTSGTSLGATPPTDVGTYTVVASFAGAADYNPTQSAPVTFTIGRSSTTIALTSSGGSAVFGQSVTFVATVGAPITPEGTVTFSDGGVPLATIPLGGSSQATLVVSSLGLGSHTVTATYNGDADVLGVQSSETNLSVDPDGTRVVLVPQATFKKKKVVLVELKAEIEPMSPGGGVPTGMVTFELTKKARKKLKVQTLGTISAAGGAATLTLKPKRVTRKVITIVYSGTSDFLASQLTAPKLAKNQFKTPAASIRLIPSGLHEKWPKSS